MRRDLGDGMELVDERSGEINLGQHGLGVNGSVRQRRGLERYAHIPTDGDDAVKEGPPIHGRQDGTAATQPEPRG